MYYGLSSLVDDFVCCVKPLIGGQLTCVTVSLMTHTPAEAHPLESPWNRKARTLAAQNPRQREQQAIPRQLEGK